MNERVGISRHSRILAVLIVAAMACSAAAQEPDREAARLVVSATRLVDQLDLVNTTYEHGRGSITWDGTVASHTDCSGFIDLLLMHDLGYQIDDLARWFGSRRPTAARYFDEIAAEHGFTRLHRVRDLRPGDLIAIKYLKRSDNTGHVMLVVKPPKKYFSGLPRVDGTAQWAIAVIDSSESGHGPDDTRNKRGQDGRDHQGLGRGVFRIYERDDGQIAGFSWSTLKVSRIVGSENEPLVLGRLVDDFHP